MTSIQHFPKPPQNPRHEKRGLRPSHVHCVKKASWITPPYYLNLAV